MRRRQRPVVHKPRPRTTGYCRPCRKDLFRSRKDAENFAASVHPGDRLEGYKCPESSGWHFGHGPPKGSKRS